MKKSINIIGKFEKKTNFGFLIPFDKQNFSSDFFVALRNSNKAQNGDVVEAVEINNKKGKNKEAKIIKIIDLGKENILKKFGVNPEKCNYKSDETNLVEGFYSQGRGDFGFVDVEGIEKGYFVFGENKHGALDGDKVKAKLRIYKGKQEAIIVKITERKTDLIVGEYVAGKNNSFGFVIPKNPNVRNDIFVPGKFSREAKTGDIVGVLVTKWDGKNPEGEVREILGKKTDRGIDLDSLIIEGGGKLSFTDEVLDYARKLESKISKQEYIKRNDLSNLLTFTIDGEDAKDLDDAISIKKIENGYKLFVHIADVAHYVKEKSLLDLEAYKRATSTYLVDRVLPMLPEKLSNDLCSLNAGTQKLAITCEMIIGNNGKIKSSKIYESIIKSDYRLTYKWVDEVLNLEQPSPQPSPLEERGLVENKDMQFEMEINGENFGEGMEGKNKLLENLRIADDLKEKILRYREEVGVLNFDFPETKIILDIDSNPVSVEEYPRYNSNKLIEAFMICANEAVSMEFSKYPFLYRIHEKPSEDDIANLEKTLNLFDVKFKFKNASTKEFGELLVKISKLEEGKKMFLEKIILRTLSKAVYSHDNVGHFGLGLDFYSHFTSPIRRYPDLQIHRIIKEKIANKLDKKRQNHYKEILEIVSNHTSDRERKSEKLEYKIRDYYIVKFYKNKVGQEFEGIISGVLPRGFFVVLPDTAEGFVELSNTDYNQELQEHFDIAKGKRYRLGDKVLVRLIEVDEIMIRLNFGII